MTLIAAYQLIWPARLTSPCRYSSLETSESDDNSQSDDDSQNDETSEGDESGEESDEASESDESFEVLVGTGSDQKRFELNHFFMTRRSEFFCVARSERWTSKSKPTELPEHEPSTFDMYLYVLDNDALPERPYPEHDEPWVRWEEEKEQYYAALQTFRDVRYTELVKLYILASYLLDPATANLTIDQIRKFMVKDQDFVPSTELINFALDSTSKDDGLRAVFAVFFVYYGGCLDPELQKEFFILVTDRYSRMQDCNHEYVVVKEEPIENFGRVGIGSWEDFSCYYQICPPVEELGIFTL